MFQGGKTLNTKTKDRIRSRFPLSGFQCPHHVRLTKQSVRLFAIVIAILAVITVLIWPLPQPPETPVKSTFLGFTNELTGPVALFSISNLPGGPTPELRDVAYQENGAWRSRGIPIGIFVRYSTDTNNVWHIIMALPVAMTNQSMRAVFMFPRQESSLRELVQRAFKRITTRSQPQPAVSHPVRARSLFFTNRTVMGKAVDASEP